MLATLQQCPLNSTLYETTCAVPQPVLSHQESLQQRCDKLAQSMELGIYNCVDYVQTKGCAHSTTLFKKKCDVLMHSTDAEMSKICRCAFIILLILSRFFY